jgi:hypothetical protein
VAFGACLFPVATAGASPAVLLATGSQAHSVPVAAGRWAEMSRGPDGLGIQPGKIRHVWLIIMENKSYDATFTGLNDNTYLWRTLPSEGALLTQYYGTGHNSMDNYISLVSGQAPITDTQDDCPYYDVMSGSVDMSGSFSGDPDYGQFVSAAGPNAAAGQNGCVYPSSVQTLFDQFDAAGVSWKGYAQDLNDPNLTSTASTLPSNSAGSQYCGAPYAAPGVTGSTSQPNPGSANPTDQYVPKHFPFPWFESLVDAGDCSPSRIANLFDPGDGLYHDLQSEATTPAFSWITPDNCSDAHDAVCSGNNLSGGWADPTTPNAPVNYTGGLYAGDLFLEHVVPEIEASPAFRDGGLIDITFDEAFPPFTYSGNSFANSTAVPPGAATSIADDTAGETLFGRSVNWQPQGPNTPLAKAPNGQELYPGDGFNAYVDRPGNCVAQTVPPQPAGVCLLGGGGTVPGARTDAKATAAAGSNVIADNSIVATDAGRSISGAGVPAGAYVGQVTDTPVTATGPKGSSGGFVDTGSFTLVGSSGQPMVTTAAVSGVVLGAETPQTDPLYDADDPTNGGGDTGSVLISPYIRPGTVSNVYYNHYSWLRTMEDLFDAKKGSAGLDGQGHLGYAAQPGLAPFGDDVFTNPAGHPAHGGAPVWLAAFPLTGAAAGGALPRIARRRRRARALSSAK